MKTSATQETRLSVTDQWGVELTNESWIQNRISVLEEI